VVRPPREGNSHGRPRPAVFVGATVSQRDKNTRKQGRIKRTLSPLLTPGALVLTFTCSFHSAPLFYPFSFYDWRIHNFGRNRLLRLTRGLCSSRGFLCEGPDLIIRRFWWRRLNGGGNYDLYSTHAQDTEILIGLFRRHQPPEALEIGDNYATLYFRFSHPPLLLHALLALSLNRWLDSQAGAR